MRASGTVRRGLVLVLLVSSFALAEAALAKSPANVDKQADAHLSQTLDDAIVNLLQSEYGPLPWEHVHVVDGLGTWGAGRRKSSHQGTDFVLDLPPVGEQGRLYVGAILEGRVLSTKPDWGSYGNTVFVLKESAPQLLFVYAHLDAIWVSAGENVESGELLGTFGCSGNCKGLRGKHIQNQVHVEVYALGSNFDASQVDWESKPMAQVRSKAVHDKGVGHGIDILAYLHTHAPKLCDRDTLGSAYQAATAAGSVDDVIEESRERASRARTTQSKPAQGSSPAHDAPSEQNEEHGSPAEQGTRLLERSANAPQSSPNEPKASTPLDDSSLILELLDESADLEP